MAEKSFLASVKEEITAAFADQFDRLAAYTNAETALAEDCRTTQRQVWDIVERRLKESFRNGQKTKETNGKPPVPEPAETRRNPFR